MSTFRGIVQKGIQHGTRLGFPTANIPLEDESVSGIYAARVQVDGNEYVAAVFANQARKILEAYLVDFPAQVLYGKEMRVELHKKLRDSKVFPDERTLQTAITKDIRDVREYFNHA